MEITLKIKALVHYSRPSPTGMKEKIIGKITSYLGNGMYKISLITGEKNIIASQDSLELIERKKKSVL